MTAREAAAYLGYKLQTLYNKVAAGEIKPSARISKRVLRFRKSDLDAWVAAQAEEAAAAAA